MEEPNSEDVEREIAHRRQRSIQETAAHSDITRLRCFEVKGRCEVDNAGAFFIRKQDAETFARGVNGTVVESAVTDQQTIGYLLGPRHVPDAIVYFLRKGYLAIPDLAIEDRAAVMRAFGYSP